jgi:hypothetical protein
MGLANHIKIMKGKSLLDSFLYTFANSPKSRFLRSFEDERFLPNSPTCVGDFNEILEASEHVGGFVHPE